MSYYELVFSKSAEMDLMKLPSKMVQRIIPAISDLKMEPRPVGCKKLKGFIDLWRIRVGDYRVIYAIKDKVKIVDIRCVGHRKDIYD